MNCVILDDEPLAIDLLSKYITDTESLSLAFASTNAFEAIQFIQKNEVDLIFLDVQMPELTGIQVLKILGNNYKVILTTAYSDYALESYDYNIADYLLKPISYERFLKSLSKVNGTNGTTTKTLAMEDDFIFIKTDGKMVKINLTEILFIEGLKDYISIQTTKEKLITLQNLKAVEQQLSAHQFMRVHKSFIIALNKIDTIERNRIFIGSNAIPIGDTYRELFLKRIERGKGG
jgi:two-component system, LytTR family, response regulator